MRKVYLTSEEVETGAIQYNCPYCHMEVVDYTDTVEDNQTEYCLKCSNEYIFCIE